MIDLLEIMMPSNTAVVGCMFAGKTQHLIKLYNTTSKSKIAIKWSNDLRYSSDSIVSHDNSSIPALSYTNLLDIDIRLLSDIETIFIDESQFFNDLVEFISAMNILQKNIVFAGLEYDSNRNVFGQTIKATSMCNDIVRLYAICSSCGNNANISKKTVANDGIIDIGGSDKYQPVCDDCY